MPKDIAILFVAAVLAAGCAADPGATPPAGALGAMAHGDLHVALEIDPKLGHPVAVMARLDGCVSSEGVTARMRGVDAELFDPGYVDARGACVGPSFRVDLDLLPERKDAVLEIRDRTERLRVGVVSPRARRFFELQTDLRPGTDAALVWHPSTDRLVPAETTVVFLDPAGEPVFTVGHENGLRVDDHGTVRFPVPADAPSGEGTLVLWAENASVALDGCEGPLPCRSSQELVSFARAAVLPR